MNTLKLKYNGHELRLQTRDDADASVAAEIFTVEEYRIVESIIREATDPILDIGAHAGFFTLYARSLNPLVKIVAVEPEPGNLEALAKQLSENQITNVEVVKAALSSKTGNRKLAIARDSHNHRLTTSGDSSAKQNFISVYTYSLSDLLKKCTMNKISLLKMDIEGGEFEIFESLSPEILSQVNCFILEYHERSGDFRDIEAKLRENKFAVQVFPSHFDKKMGFIFAKSKHK